MRVPFQGKRRLDRRKSKGPLEVEPIGAFGVLAERGVAQALGSGPAGARARARPSALAGSAVPGVPVARARSARRGRWWPAVDEQPRERRRVGRPSERRRGPRGSVCGAAPMSAGSDPVDRRASGARLAGLLAGRRCRRGSGGRRRGSWRRRTAGAPRRPRSRPRRRRARSKAERGHGRAAAGRREPQPDARRRAPSSSRSVRPPPWRPRSATQTTGNSSPLARWIVISRTASRPSDSSGASPSRAAARSRVAA